MADTTSKHTQELVLRLIEQIEGNCKVAECLENVTAASGEANKALEKYRKSLTATDKAKNDLWKTTKNLQKGIGSIISKTVKVGVAAFAAFAISAKQTGESLIGLQTTSVGSQKALQGFRKTFADMDASAQRSTIALRDAARSVAEFAGRSYAHAIVSGKKEVQQGLMGMSNLLQTYLGKDATRVWEDAIGSFGNQFGSMENMISGVGKKMQDIMRLKGTKEGAQKIESLRRELQLALSTAQAYGDPRPINQLINQLGMLERKYDGTIDPATGSVMAMNDAWQTLKKVISDIQDKILVAFGPIAMKSMEIFSQFISETWQKVEKGLSGIDVDKFGRTFLSFLNIIRDGLSWIIDIALPAITWGLQTIANHTIASGSVLAVLAGGKSIFAGIGGVIKAVMSLKSFKAPKDLTGTLCGECPTGGKGLARGAWNTAKNIGNKPWGGGILGTGGGLLRTLGSAGLGLGVGQLTKHMLGGPTSEQNLSKRGAIPLKEVGGLLGAAAVGGPVGALAYGGYEIGSSALQTRKQWSDDSNTKASLREQNEKNRSAIEAASQAKSNNPLDVAKAKAAELTLEMLRINDEVEKEEDKWFTDDKKVKDLKQRRSALNAQRQGVYKQLEDLDPAKKAAKSERERLARMSEAQAKAEKQRSEAAKDAADKVKEATDAFGIMLEHAKALDQRMQGIQSAAQALPGLYKTFGRAMDQILPKDSITSNVAAASGAVDSSLHLGRGLIEAAERQAEAERAALPTIAFELSEKDKAAGKTIEDKRLEKAAEIEEKLQQQRSVGYQHMARAGQMWEASLGAAVAKEEQALDVLGRIKTSASLSMQQSEAMYGTAAMAVEQRMKYLEVLNQEKETLAAQVEQYERIIQAERSKKEIAEAALKTAGDEKERKKLQDDIANSQARIHTAQMRQLDAANKVKQVQLEQLQNVKELRDGYLDAVQAQAFGAGKFSKIIIDQEKNLGLALDKGMAKQNFLLGAAGKNATGSMTPKQFTVGGYGLADMQGGKINSAEEMQRLLAKMSPAEQAAYLAANQATSNPGAIDYYINQKSNMLPYAGVSGSTPAGDVFQGSAAQQGINRPRLPSGASPQLPSGKSSTPAGGTASPVSEGSSGGGTWSNKLGQAARILAEAGAKIDEIEASKRGYNPNRRGPNTVL